MELCREKTGEPLKISLMMVISRVCVSCAPAYWIITHCIALLLISLLLVTFWVWKYWKVSSWTTILQNKYENYIEKVNKCDDLERDLKMIDKLEVPQYYPKANEIDKTRLLFGLIPIIVHFVFFVVYGVILWTVDQNFKKAIPKRIKIDEEHPQGVYFPLAWVIVISYTFLCVWFRLFQKNEFKMKWQLFLLAVLALISIVV